MNMRNIKKLFWRNSENATFEVNSAISGKFGLYIGKLLIGELKYSDGKWCYCYSEEFKRQSRYKPLVNFPDVEKIYEAEEDKLWPFFASRLPGAWEVNGNNDTNTVELLQRYGERVITNPYILRLI